MATISPAITISNTPGLEISTAVPGMSYLAFINMLGSIVYEIEEMYYGNSMLAQLFNPIKYNEYNNFGTSEGKVITTPVSVNQFQPTMYLKLKGRGVFVNGQSTMDFIMLAGNATQFIFYAKRREVMGVIDHAGYINNFKEVESSLGKAGFFVDDQEDLPEPPAIEFVSDNEGEELPPMVVKPSITTLPKQQTFLLIIRNNTTGNIPVVLFEQGNPAAIIANATTRYAWDITGVSFSNSAISFSFWPVGSSTISTTLTGTATNAQSLVALLNSFNNGSFWLETSGPNTYVVTWNDNVVYGDLVIGVATTTIAWSNTSVDSSMQIDRNAVNIINSAAPPQSGSVSVNNGDVIDGTYVFGVALPFTTLLIRRTLKVPPFTANTIYTDVGTSVGGIVPSFLINTAYNYSITLTTP